MDRNSRLKRLSLWLPALLWYAVIFFFSAQTGTESSAVSDAVLTDFFRLDLAHTSWDLFLLLSFLVRKGAHAFVYFVQTGLLLLPLWPLLKSPKVRTAVALGGCALLAALDEIHQLFVPGRSGKLSDVIIDTLGGVCFLLCLWLVQWLLKRRRDRESQPDTSKTGQP